MSIKIVQGDLLDANEDILVHQVNCIGVMGSGVALQIKEKWPEVYEKYSNYTEGPANAVWRRKLLGETLWVRTGDNKWIVNVFGQYDYGRNGKQYTEYGALKRGLENVAYIAESLGLSVALPYKIGCGSGGGNWEDVVFPMILNIFEKVDVDVKIYHRRYT